MCNAFQAGPERHVITTEALPPSKTFRPIKKKFLLFCVRRINCVLARHISLSRCLVYYLFFLHTFYNRGAVVRQLPTLQLRHMTVAYKVEI